MWNLDDVTLKPMPGNKQFLEFAFTGDFGFCNGRVVFQGKEAIENSKVALEWFKDLLGGKVNENWKSKIELIEDGQRTLLL